MDLDEKTIVRYEQLSFFEREEILHWIEENLSTIPLPIQIKKVALNNLLSGFCSSRSTLLLIRYAMNALKIEQDVE